jgi:integrase
VIKLKKIRIITTVLAKRVSQISIGPACSARLAAARLRRACWVPILAPPPVRAIQTWIPLESKNGKHQIILDYEGNSVYKKRNYWLVLTRTLLAGFNAPIDTIDKFILDRGKEIMRSTLNKDIRNLRAFIHWCRKNRYLNGEIELSLLKEDELPVKSLSGSQIQELLTASIQFPALRMRILLALSTGLRRGDVESLRVSDLDFENNSVTTRSTKTRKSM